MKTERLIFLGFGVLFGALLTRSGATDYDYYAKLFLFTDLQLVWVIGGAVVVGVPGVLLLRRSGARAAVGGLAIDFSQKPIVRGLAAGAVLLGIGWGLTAACPGTVLAMLGQAKLAAVPTIAGILIGTWSYGWFQDRKASVDSSPKG